jgi:hypothetical protein
MLGVEVPPVSNLATEMSLYHSYRASMLEQGHLYWVKHSVDSDIFVLNNYSSLSSVFQPTNYIRADIVDGRVVYCGCDTYKTLRGSGVNGVCMHCRFLEEEVVPCMEMVQQPEFAPSSGIGSMVSKAWQDKNVGCVCLGPATGKVCKFCVTGRDITVSFVHMSVD